MEPRDVGPPSKSRLEQQYEKQWNIHRKTRPARIARMLFGGKIELGAIYLELFARYFIDLTPAVAPIAAMSSDREGNYQG